MPTHSIFVRLTSLSIALVFVLVATMGAALAYPARTQVLGIDGDLPGNAPAAPLIDEQDIFDAQEDIWGTLFGTSYDPGSALLELDAAVTEAGGTVTGLNNLNQDFTYDVVMAGAVDLQTLNLPAAQLTAMQQADASVTGVHGTLSTELGSLPVLGIAMAMNHPQLGFRSVLHTSYVMDLPTEDSLAMQGDGSGGDDGRICLPGGLIIDWKSFECTDGDCVDACRADYDDAMADADATLSNCEGNAQADRNQTITDAQNEYSSALGSADTRFVAALSAATLAFSWAAAACSSAGGFLAFFTAGVALAACLAIAHASYAFATYQAYQARDKAYETAGIIRDLKLSNANYAYDAAAGVCQADYDTASQAAATALEDCLSGCETTCFELNIYWIPPFCGGSFVGLQSRGN